jgi:hypothetical protein
MEHHEQEISITVKRSEAIVLFDLLSRHLDDNNSNLIELRHDSEDVVLNNILCFLESELVAPFENDYEKILSKARMALR